MQAATPMTGPYNAAVDLLGRNLAQRSAKPAFIDPAGEHTFAEVAARSARMGAALLGLGLAPGDRVALVLHDGIDLVSAFLGAIRAGLVPIPLNTLFQAQDYAYILTDSGARAIVVSEALVQVVNGAASSNGWSGELVVSGETGRTVADLLVALEETGDELEEIHAGSQTLAAAFELSYRNLPASQQRMFRGLGTHPGPDIDARAAAALDGADLAQARRLLDALYDDHLIEETTRGRYGMHDLLRAYARALSAADKAAAREARIDRLLDDPVFFEPFVPFFSPDVSGALRSRSRSTCA